MKEKRNRNADNGIVDVKHDTDTGGLDERFLARYAFVVEVACRYAPSPDVVHDIVQDVFLKLLRFAGRRDWDFEKDIDPLLAVMTRNIAIDHAKAIKRENRLKRIDDRILETLENKDINDSPSSDRNEMTALRNCMERIPEKNRELLKEYYWNKTTTEELAGKTGRSESAVHQLLYRIRLKLRNCMERYIHGQ